MLALLEGRDVKAMPLSASQALELAVGPGMMRGPNPAIAHEGLGPGGAKAGANNGNRSQHVVSRGPASGVSRAPSRAPTAPPSKVPSKAPSGSGEQAIAA